jgi:hypothetical protein
MSIRGPDDADSLAELLTHKSLDGVESKEALKMLAQLVDLAGVRGDKLGLDLAFAWSDELSQRALGGPDLLLGLYYRANIWGHVERIRSEAPDHDKLDWKQPELQEEMLLLRRVAANPSFPELHRVQQAQVLTNLGNVFSTVGRVVEAIELRDRVLTMIPRFGMARGTRAESIMAYGQALQRTKDRLPFLRAAVQGFASATSEEAFYESAGYEGVVEKWRAKLNELSELLSRNTPADEIRRQETGNAPSIPYRQWCLDQRLYLSPLNDLGSADDAASDRLHLPAPVPHNARSEMLMGYLDAMQQELVSARWSYYEATSLACPHDSDATLHIHDTGDGPVYGLRVERMKSVFRTAYSVMDKIAFFLNAYISLGMQPRDISFRRIWFEKNLRSTPAALAKSENWPLRGLFWLSRDLFEPEFVDITEPDAKALAEIRNHIEHKYLRVVKHDVAAPVVVGRDPLIFVVDQKSFEDRTLRLLKLARAALVYLVLAVHVEEMKQPPVPQGTRKTALPRLRS